MPFPNEHAARLEDPDKFDDIRRRNDMGGPGIDFLFGIMEGPPRTSDLQSIHFDKEKFTPAEAREWLDDHDFEPILFEEASGESEMSTESQSTQEGAGIYDTPKKKKRKERKKSFDFCGRSINPAVTRYVTNKRHKALAKAHNDEDPEDRGFVQGYAATFGNVDLVDEMFIKGAFAKSIEEIFASGKTVPLMERHFRDGGDVAEMRGTVTKAFEDDFGLFFTAEFEPDERSQNLRRQMVEGKVNTFSVGFQMVLWEFMSIGERSIMAHTEDKFLEVTATLKPLNPMASLVKAKSMPELKEEIKNLCDLLQVDPDQLTPENAGRLLSEHVGSVEDARAFSVGVHALLGKIDGLLESQNTSEETGGTEEAASIITEADLLSMKQELELRRVRARRLMV